MSSPVAVLVQAEQRAAGLLDGRAVEVDVYAFVCDGKLEGHGLVGLRHDVEKLRLLSFTAGEL